MVAGGGNDCRATRYVSVLALSSRFDGPVLPQQQVIIVIVSVLALSSRFDGPAACSTGTASCQTVSVLALSSRFDGQ